jgi:F-box interacting protein
MPSSSTNDKLYIDGMCHWLSRTDDHISFEVERHLVSFDLRNEAFLTTMLPSDITEHYVLLHLLNGSIAFIKYDETTTFDIRILGEIGVKESWAKIFVVESLPCIECPIGAGKKGDIFYIKDDDELVWSSLHIL